MKATIIRYRPREGADDTYAGTLHVALHVGLDDADDPVHNTHDLARLLLTVSPADLAHVQPHAWDDVMGLIPEEDQPRVYSTVEPTEEDRAAVLDAYNAGAPVTR